VHIVAPFIPHGFDAGQSCRFAAAYDFLERRRTMNILRYNVLDELFKGFWVRPQASPVETHLERKAREPEAKQDKKAKQGKAMHRDRAA
jgi:hypothetical protein